MSLNMRRSPPHPQASLRGLNFLLLLQLRDRAGRLRVPQRHVEDGQQLGNWIGKQNADSSLMKRVPQRITTTPGGMSLNLRPPCPPPPPSPPQAVLWESYFLLLLKFRDREGHLRVPKLHVEAGQNLGRWICKHRLQKKQGGICPEKEGRLNAIGFVWNVHDAQFNIMVTALEQFEQREGHCNVLHRHIEHLDGVKLKLGVWLKSRRCRQGRGKTGAVKESRERQLENMGVKWTKQQGITD
jgi:hypothetical protein